MAKCQICGNQYDMDSEGYCPVCGPPDRVYRWYRKAADQGNAIAQFKLGWMYDTGQGVAQDDAAALSWYRKAADQGNAAAQSNLSLMDANGRGGAQDEGAAP